MDPERLLLDAGGMTFGALAWGSTDAPLALLIHGYPDSAWTWRHLGPYLAERGWRAVAPFTRGYAPTDLAPNDTYFASDQAGDILALHTALGGDERAVLVGHDWGALATWTVTATEPARFARYVTMALPPPSTLLKPATSVRTLGVAARQLRMSWYFAYNQLPGAERTLDKVIPKHWRDWSPGYDATEDLAFLRDATPSAEFRRAAASYYRAMASKGSRAALVEPIHPVLALQGDRDGAIDPGFFPAVRARTTANSRSELIPCVGHFLHLEEPELVTERILDFLS